MNNIGTYSEDYNNFIKNKNDLNNLDDLKEYRTFSNEFLNFIKIKLIYFITETNISITDIINVIFLQHLTYHINDNNINICLENAIKNTSKRFKEKNYDNKTISYILNRLCNLSKDVKYDRVNKIYDEIINKIKENINDSLLIEILNLNMTDKNINILLLNKNLINLINKDDKSKNLIDNITSTNIVSDEKSKNLYYSVITQTNWIDELEYGNFMGLLISIKPNKLNMSGHNLDHIPINEITHTIIGFDQILEVYKMKRYEDDYIYYGDIISGNGVGNGNCIIPLYINEMHWKCVKLYFDYNMGLIFNRNPFNSTYKHQYIYAHLLFKMINHTFSNEEYRSDKWINLLFSVLRTNYEIYKTNKNLDKFAIDKCYRIDCNLYEITLEFLFNKSFFDIRLLFEEFVRRSFKNIYKDINVLDEIYNFDETTALNYDIHSVNKHYLINENKFNDWIYELQKNSIFSEKNTLIYGVIMLKNIISKNNFFELFDQNNGILNDIHLFQIKKFISEVYLQPVNYELFGLLNPKFSSHINYTKEKVYSINTFTKLKLVEDNDQLKELFIQCLIQRVNKSRRNAIKNNKIQNPFYENNIIAQTGLLISQRYLKKFYNLNNNDDYINILNNISLDKFDKFIDIMISKTISLKKHIISNINLLESNRKDIIFKKIEI